MEREIYDVLSKDKLITDVYSIPPLPNPLILLGRVII